jgi:hypothetical protein
MLFSQVHCAGTPVLSTGPAPQACLDCHRLLIVLAATHSVTIPLPRYLRNGLTLQRNAPQVATSTLLQMASDRSIIP